VTRVLAFLALASAVALGLLAVRESNSQTLREAPECARGPNIDGVLLVGGQAEGRGYVPCDNRAAWDAFRGGGPGSGK
jgi:hypothetical protein